MYLYIYVIIPKKIKQYIISLFWWYSPCLSFWRLLYIFIAMTVLIFLVRFLKATTLVAWPEDGLSPQDHDTWLGNLWSNGIAVYRQLFWIVNSVSGSTKLIKRWDIDWEIKLGFKSCVFSLIWDDDPTWILYVFPFNDWNHQQYLVWNLGQGSWVVVGHVVNMYVLYIHLLFMWLFIWLFMYSIYFFIYVTQESL